MKPILYSNNKKFKHIVIILTILFFSCNNYDYQINDIKGENIIVLDSIVKNEELDKLIKPYRNKIKKLQKVIGYSEKYLSIRDGVLESSLGNLLADILIEESNPVFNKISSKKIDFCLLNYGGIRGNLNKGQITQHDLFTIMPFNNTSTVVKLSGEKVLELIQYINKEKLAHPVSGIKIEFKGKKINRVLIRNKKFNIDNTYYILTSNFLQEGGDKMIFFKNPLELYSLKTNIRDVLINYIMKKDTIVSKTDNRIIRL
ncbi:uncharacterized protein METZ01_LOCUS36530 [marine metagenome]|uniref:5'-Nucleotidase C-terminal domain-containing protein n=1 Tax=marine metagenome TaxID=408172 RepID=A0A381QW72_9ZZZZ